MQSKIIKDATLASLMHCYKYKCRKTLLPFIVGNKTLRESESHLIHRKIYGKPKSLISSHIDL